jgi:hypothetical protein
MSGVPLLCKNLHRRHLTISQRGAIAADVVPMLRDEAHKRQVAAGSANITGKSSPLGYDLEKGRSDAIAAEALQVGERTVTRALEVKRNNPEAFERVKRGETTVNEANGLKPRMSCHD